MSRKRGYCNDEEVKTEKINKPRERGWWWKDKGLEYIDKEGDVSELRVPVRILNLKEFLLNFLTPSNEMEKDE